MQTKKGGIIEINEYTDSYDGRILDFRNYDGCYKESKYYFIPRDYELMEEYMSEDFLLTITKDDIAKALAEEHDRMMKESVGKKFAYVLTCACAKGLEINHIMWLICEVIYDDLTEINEIMTDLESKLW